MPFRKLLQFTCEALVLKLVPSTTGTQRYGDLVPRKLAVVIGASLAGIRRRIQLGVRHRLSMNSLARANMSTNSNYQTSRCLPKLPVPPLSQTFKYYLEAVKIAAPDRFDQVAQWVNEDWLDEQNGIGAQLQDFILKRSEERDNWAYDWWMDDMYLKNPIPLPVHSNPGMVFPFSTTGINGFTYSIARFVEGILDFKHLIDRGLLPQDVAASREKGQHLCMQQYQRLFTVCRIPGTEKDRQQFTPAGPDEHIIVAYKNQFWKLDVKRGGKRLSMNKIWSQLDYIYRDATTEVEEDVSPQPPVGILTTEVRTTWGRIREQLFRDPVNAQSLDYLESCLMVVCLDEALPLTFNADKSLTVRDDTNKLLQMLHGGSSRHNSCNRWFDKTLQFIFSPDNVSGFCYEHSAAEGIVTVQMIETVLQNLKATPLDEILATHSVEIPKADCKPLHLQWKLDADIEASIQSATIRMDSLVESLDYRLYHFTDYGKNFIKTCKVSPDVYVQLALQLTYFKLHNQMCSTYESASTRRYRHGRVDCIRSSTLPALVWVQAMTSGEEEEKCHTLFASAADYQTHIMVANILGQGMDIHILGFRETAKLLGNTKALQLFTDPSYEAVNHFSLSTSQIPTQTASYMGYGPVVPDGYGASYNPKEAEIVFGVSSFHTCPTSSSTRFVETLKESLLAMRTLLEKKP